MGSQFQIDSTFYDHPKALAMSDAATALWVRAGSYSADKLLNGFVPLEALALLSDAPDAAARELVARELWAHAPGGFEFSTDDHPRVLGRVTRNGSRPWIPYALRRAVYERDGHRCVGCGNEDQLSLDHITPWSMGGQDTLDNLRTYCLPCNWARGARA